MWQYGRMCLIHSPYPVRLDGNPIPGSHSVIMRSVQGTGHLPEISHNAIGKFILRGNRDFFHVQSLKGDAARFHGIVQSHGYESSIQQRRMLVIPARMRADDTGFNNIQHNRKSDISKRRRH